MRDQQADSSNPLHTNPDDTWLRIIGIPLAVVPFVYFYVREYGFDWRLVFFTFGFGLCSTTMAWQLLRWWVFRVRARYAQKEQTRRRVLMTFGGYTLLTILLQPFETFGVSQIDPTGLVGRPEFPRVYIIQMGMALAFANIVGGYYEIQYYLHLYRHAMTEAEALMKAQVQQQLDRVKSQVNPHFLFNSLNCLSALVHENPQVASAFLDELATVYRYLLQANANQLVPLRTELDFIRSYGYLLQIRYGQAIRWTVQTDQIDAERLLPPLTLQVLVENALQHNIIDSQQPLQMRIAVSADSLTVTNSIQRKTRPIKVQRGGLINLTSRFSALRLRPPRISDDGQFFTVEVPLVPVKSELVESIA
ncbi:hypothetical protein GCM10023189_35880 [Nibrella saemangeumensis]|uniref:Signal transduction histidine kinase internal region domain-containing protein n=1 Tax=Nibrella saemangeumensis TaxID=1084526 RepID=A0ABP8N3B6_9BACT